MQTTGEVIISAVSSGKQFAAGQFVSVVSRANNANYMHGQVTSYSGTTLAVNVLDTGGAGTFSDWNVSISSPQGATGTPGSLPYTQIAQTVVSSPVATVDFTGLSLTDVILNFSTIQQNSGGGADFSLYYSTDNGSTWTLWGYLSASINSGTPVNGGVSITGLNLGPAVLFGYGIASSSAPPKLSVGGTNVTGGYANVAGRMNGLRIAVTAGSISAGTITLLGR